MVILDVREKEEFQAQSIPGSICCPLSQFDVMAPGILPLIQDEEVVVMCRSGKRATMALEGLKNLIKIAINFLFILGAFFNGKPMVKKWSVRNPFSQSCVKFKLWHHP